MTEEELKQQEAIHDALVRALPLDDGEYVTGWVVLYESQTAGDTASAGHYYGPAGMTTWRAMGLLEFSKYRSMLGVAQEDDD